MTQIASLLAVATVFIDLWTPFYSQGGGGGLIRETKLPMQEHELKMQGGLCEGGGVIAGFYGTRTCTHNSDYDNIKPNNINHM